MNNATPTTSQPPGGSRLNLLLSYGGWRETTAIGQLPQLLAPMGIYSIRVDTGEEAAHAIDQFAIHIAVVDLAIPLQRAASSKAGGARILQLLRRLQQPPPTVVIRPPQVTQRQSARGLTDALREGAFAVLDRPIEIESMLEVMRRILRRHYADVWPLS
jgi:DNA-binding response OmpR family regulator